MKAHRQVSTDAHLIALMSVIAQMAGDGKYVDILTDTAIAGTRKVLRSLSVSTPLDDTVVSSYEIVSRGVERCQEEICPQMETRRAARALLHAVNDATNNEPIVGIDRDVLLTAFTEYADAGMLFGAALMYALLKGGVR